MAKRKLTLEEAAEHLGTTTDEIMVSRWRGMEPGSLGFKEAGILYFNTKDLKPAASPKPKKAEEEANGK